MFCQKCGKEVPEGADFCNSCGVKSQEPNQPIHWLSAGLLFLTFITFGLLGGDYYYEEVNFFDYLSIPISIAALVAAIVTIPKKRMILKVICIILSSFMVLGTIGWALL